MSPVACTVATRVSDDCQVIARPASTVPLASLRLAVACAVCPVSAVAGVIDTITLATGIGEGAVTSTAAVPETPSLTALTTVLPAAIAETIPDASTVATAMLELYH